jgi:hypothetical protein
MVSNLQSFPSHLNLIQISDGDYEEHLLKLHLNLNMKRLGCSGRSALTLGLPGHAQTEKFYQLFKMSEIIPVDQGVFELVILFQTCLFLMGYLPSAYCDGILCDSTVIALQQYAVNYNVGADLKITSDFVCSITLITSLMSQVLELCNKMAFLGYQIPKDPFSTQDQISDLISLWQAS